jgi:hypothetical protein
MANGGQGQSVATLDKARRVSSAISVSLRIANCWAKRTAWRDFGYWHFDANAGSGWNDRFDVPGSPVIFHAVADHYLKTLGRRAFFCESNKDAMLALMGRIGENSAHLAKTIFVPTDNDTGLRAFADAIRDHDKPEYALGSVIIDPNSYWDRCLDGSSQVPFEAAFPFFDEFRRIDVTLNLNLTAYWRMRSPGNAQVMRRSFIAPHDLLKKFSKKFWYVGLTGTSNGTRFLLAVGTNFPAKFHPNLHDIGSAVGRAVMNKAWLGSRAADPEPSRCSDLFLH